MRLETVCAARALSGRPLQFDGWYSGVASRHGKRQRAHKYHLWALQLRRVSVDRWATGERSLQIEREGADHRCGGTSRDKYHPIGKGKVGSRVGRLLQHRKEVRKRGGREREGVVRVNGSRTAVEVVEKDFVSRASRLRLREHPSARTWTVRGKGVIE